MLCTVDLAAKFSAVMFRTADGEIHEQFDSAGLSAFQFLAKLANAVKRWDPELIIVEDVPYGVSSQAQTKPVTRMQGILIAVLHQWLDRVYFLNPSTWQKAYPGVGSIPRGMPKMTQTQKDQFRIQKAQEYAAEFGYTPPDLVAAYVASLPEGAKVLKKHTNPLEKSMTDYVDAFLMSHWVYSFDSLDEVKTLQGVQPAWI